MYSFERDKKLIVGAGLAGSTIARILAENDSKGNLKTITYEKPCSIEANPGEYYYQVKTNTSKKILSAYENLSKRENSITFIGRTGLFKYIDMIPSVEIHKRIA